MRNTYLGGTSGGSSGVERASPLQQKLVIFRPLPGIVHLKHERLQKQRGVSRRGYIIAYRFDICWGGCGGCGWRLGGSDYWRLSMCLRWRIRDLIRPPSSSLHQYFRSVANLGFIKLEQWLQPPSTYLWRTRTTQTAEKADKGKGY